MSEPLVVVGGTVAALVAADAAARAGREVVLVLPRRGVGGGFAPLLVDGHRLDRGLRALELHYEGVGEPPPLEAYDAAGAGHRPYVRLIETLVRGLAGDVLVELDRPKMWFGGRLVDELHTTCDLTGLRGLLTSAQASAVLAEAPGGDEAVNLLDPRRADELASLSVADASRAQHGATFHALFIAPLAAKLRAEGAADVPATLRRKLWLPLFHPHTLREAAAGGVPSYRPERPFHTIEPGGTGRLVTALLARIAAASSATIREVDGIAAVEPVGPGGELVRITPTGEAPFDTHRPILALAPGELFAAAGVAYAPVRARSVMAWLDVADDDIIEVPSFVHVVDAEVPVFRVSRGERAGGRTTVCVELAHDVPKADAGPVAATALIRMGLVRASAPPTALAAFAGETFTAPTFVNAARFAAARGAYDALGLPAETIGGSEAFGADSFNEQVVQGLRAAARSARRPGRAAAPALR